MIVTRTDAVVVRAGVMAYGGDDKHCDLGGGAGDWRPSGEA